MEVAMANSRPEVDDGFADGYVYPYRNDSIGYHSTAWIQPITIQQPPPFVLKIDGCNNLVYGEAKFLDANGDIVARCDVYPRTVTIQDPAACSFVFCLSIEDKKTVKFTDTTHNVVLFENGRPGGED